MKVYKIFKNRRGILAKAEWLNAIVLKDVTKQFDNFLAVRNLSFEVFVIFGFLGPRERVRQYYFGRMKGLLTTSNLGGRMKDEG
jgi:hypothetical protein